MLVLAVVGVLVAIAYPAYRDYVTRARVSEGLVFADAARVPVELALAGGGNPPADLLASASGQAGHMMTGLSWTAGKPGSGVLGYILAEMQLPGMGVKKALALELRSSLDWHCVDAQRYVGIDAGLEPKYLPSSCRGDAGAMGRIQAQAMAGASSAAGGAAQASCTPGMHLASRPTANNKWVQACVPDQAAPAVPRSQSDCATGQIYLAGPPATCSPAPVHVAAAAASTPTAPSCSNGVASNGQCIPTCRPGWELKSSDNSVCVLAGSPKVHLCQGPKFICERAHAARSGCPQDRPFAANFVENLQDGSRYVTRDCISLANAFKAVADNAKRAECRNYSVDSLQAAHFSCTFPCYGAECNKETVPTSGVPSWDKRLKDPATGKLRDRTEQDLPDMFDRP
nr:pilin [Paucibacter sp. B51]